MSKEKRELAELMGWKDPRIFWPYDPEEPKKSGKIQLLLIGGPMLRPKGRNWFDIKKVPDYDTDLNAMREVWKVLKERGLWPDFIQLCDKKDYEEKAHDQMSYFTGFIYGFLNDLPGQMEAAIKVLRE